MAFSRKDWSETLILAFSETLTSSQLFGLSLAVCSQRRFGVMEGASGLYNPRSAEEVFKDFRGRRAGLLKALTTGFSLSLSLSHSISFHLSFSLYPSLKDFSCHYLRIWIFLLFSDFQFFNQVFHYFETVICHLILFTFYQLQMWTSFTSNVIPVSHSNTLFLVKIISFLFELPLNTLGHLLFL